MTHLLMLGQLNAHITDARKDLPLHIVANCNVETIAFSYGKVCNGKRILVSAHPMSEHAAVTSHQSAVERIGCRLVRRIHRTLNDQCQPLERVLTCHP